MMNQKMGFGYTEPLVLYKTTVNPCAIRKTLNEQMFKEQPDEQLRKGNIIHRIDVDKHQTIGFGFTMLFGYSRLIVVKNAGWIPKFVSFNNKKKLQYPYISNESDKFDFYMSQ